MSLYAHGLKALQVLLIAILIDYDPLIAAARNVDLSFVAALVLLIAGQALNSGVYNALGIEGIFYGSRFGKKLPWVTGFPYNLGIRDPQYVGALTTLLGAAFFIPKDICIWWAATYGYLMWMESKVPNTV